MYFSKKLKKKKKNLQMSLAGSQKVENGKEKFKNAPK